MNQLKKTKITPSKNYIKIKHYASELVKHSTKLHDLAQLIHKWYHIEGKCKYDLRMSIVGGAVVDILDERKIKDYDVYLYHTDIKDFIEVCNFDSVSYSKTAITVIKDGIILQFLLKPKNEFDFIISQMTIDLSIKKDGDIRIVLVNSDFTTNYADRKLVPVTYDRTFMILQSLHRIPHWNKKGYHIDLLTYNSLINSLKKTITKNS